MYLHLRLEILRDNIFLYILSINIINYNALFNKYEIQIFCTYEMNLVLFNNLFDESCILFINLYCKNFKINENFKIKQNFQFVPFFRYYL